MSELFGIPVAGLAVVLAALVVVVLAVVAALAVRNRVLFKVGVRNMARRPGRTAIIVSGLMLGTMIIGSALGFGDIMSSTVRSSVITSLGQTDEVVAARSADAPDIATLGVGSSARYLTQAEAATLVEAARALPDVDGAAPAISEPVAVQDISSRTTEPQVTLFATDPAAMEGFGAITTTTGQQVSLGDLVGDQVYVNADAADDLGAAAGDQLSVSAAGRVLAVIVRDVVEYDGTGTDGGALLAQLTVGQRAVGAGTDVQQVMISNAGDEISGAESTDAVVQAMQSTVAGLGLQIEPVKRDGLEQADEEGAAYLSMFSTMGTFTISAGILLIFLVFVMLAAERRGEMGTARAIGTQRKRTSGRWAGRSSAWVIDSGPSPARRRASAREPASRSRRTWT